MVTQQSTTVTGVVLSKLNGGAFLFVVGVRGPTFLPLKQVNGDTNEERKNRLALLKRGDVLRVRIHPNERLFLRLINVKPTMLASERLVIELERRTAVEEAVRAQLRPGDEVDAVVIKLHHLTATVRITGAFGGPYHASFFTGERPHDHNWKARLARRKESKRLFLGQTFRAKVSRNETGDDGRPFVRVYVPIERREEVLIAKPPVLPEAGSGRRRRRRRRR